LYRLQARLRAAGDAAGRAALSGGLESVHREFVESLEIVDAVDEFRLKRAREAVEAAIQTQTGKIEHVRMLNERIAGARGELQQAGARRDQLSGLLDLARQALNAARQHTKPAVPHFIYT